MFAGRGKGRGKSPSQAQQEQQSSQQNTAPKPDISDRGEDETRKADFSQQPKLEISENLEDKNRDREKSEVKNKDATVYVPTLGTESADSQRVTSAWGKLLSPPPSSSNSDLPPLPTLSQKLTKVFPAPTLGVSSSVQGKGRGRGRGRGRGNVQEPAQPTPSTSSIDVEKVTESTETMSVKQNQPNVIPRRKSQVIPHSPVVCERQLTIEVNYLKLDFENENFRVFHYDCTFKPDKPKILLRPAMRTFRNKHFPRRAPAFDGQKNLYFGGKPLEIRGNVLRDTISIYDEERQKQIEFDISIKLVRDDLNLKILFEYTKNGRTKNLPQEVIQAADIALRQSPSETLTSVGRSFFKAPGPREIPVDLTGGLVLWHGHYQSAVMAWKPYLNVDVSNKAFPKQQSVLQYIESEFQIRVGQELDRDIATKVHSFLKGLKIEYKMPSNEPDGFSKRVYKCDGLDVNLSAMTHKFAIKENGPQVSVAEYYQKEKKRKLQFPKLPLVKVGSKGTMLPMEHCYIIGNQIVMKKLNEKQTSKMVSNSAQPTDVRKERIMRNIRTSGFINPCLGEFGIKVDDNFDKVKAYVLKSPDLLYKKNSVNVKNGTWNGGTFLESPPLRNWVLINTDARSQPHISRVVQTLKMSGQDIGIEVAEPTASLSCKDNDIERNLKEVVSRYRPQLCVVIMSSFMKNLYGVIKRIAELELGLLTQCIKANTIQKFNPVTAKNILLKVNAKICGKNHCLSFRSVPKPTVLTQPVMIVGADVTHPAPGTDNFPSIAAVAASHDLDGFRYNMSYQIQKPREEIIIQLADMIEAKLRFFKEKTGKEAEKILYYRDGVSEGQFYQVLHKELPSIRAACTRIRSGYNPGLTFVVVQKRHHTRFFPSKNESDGSKNRNVVVGTIVDNTITHPTELDFYLVSHQSIQGTARPTKYHLLWDDNDFHEEDLERLTYYLCYMFSRCNRSVSYPAPTYYAHLGAFRARAWFDGQRKHQQTPIHKNISEGAPMFFV